MTEREYILNLYEIYKNLLSSRECEYFEDYYYEDNSLNEIAETKEVSKSYVGKIVNQICDKLKDFENKLSIYNKNEKIKNIIKDLDIEIRSKIEEIL